MASNTTTSSHYFRDQIAHVEVDRRMVFAVIAAICLPLTWLAVALRFLARQCAAARYGWDDYTMFFALLFGSGFIVVDCLGSFYGGERQVAVQDKSILVSGGKNLLAAEVLNPLALLGSKISLLFLYRRLFPTQNFLRCTIVVGCLVAVWGISAVVVPLAQCMPINKIWDTTIAGSCIDSTTALTAFAVANIVTDILVLVMPIPMIWSLHTNLTTKLQLSGLFLTGTLVTVISIVRVIYTSQMNFDDPSWTEVNAVAWTSAEVCGSVISACLPTYRPLFVRSKRCLQAGYVYPVNGKPAKRVADGKDDPFYVISITTDVESTWHDE